MEIANSRAAMLCKAINPNSVPVERVKCSLIPEMGKIINDKINENIVNARMFKDLAIQPPNKRIQSIAAVIYNAKSYDLSEACFILPHKCGIIIMKEKPDIL
jgi:hypothetical protein